MRFISTVYGRNENSGTAYQTRIRGPYTRWGHLRLHIFWRGDSDPDPHDHPFDFWTFPLSSYREMVVGEDGVEREHIVEAFKWHFRKAEHLHRVTDNVYYPGRTFVTIVWASNWRRPWGFWPKAVTVHGERYAGRSAIISVIRKFVPWREYLG